MSHQLNFNKDLPSFLFCSTYETWLEYFMESFMLPYRAFGSSFHSVSSAHFFFLSKEGEGDLLIFIFLTQIRVNTNKPHLTSSNLAKKIFYFSIYKSKQKRFSRRIL